MLKSIALASSLLAALAGAAPVGSAELDAARERMVREIAEHAAAYGVEGHTILAPAVLAAMRKVPRHLFVRTSPAAKAYENRPMSIGLGQTISQPYIVALMTDAVKPARDHVVLEVGTGSGYQAAVLATLVKHVYTIEIVKPLAKEAGERLRKLGYRNVTVRQGDGYAGWPEHAPFDAIVVTAGAPQVPEPLVRQLKRGGRMVIPVGDTRRGQTLILITKGADGRVQRRSLGPVLFVPMTGTAQRAKDK